ncbi:PAS domain-containing protein [Polyangium jinanense]|uniref:PAS domain-containing protein n=1 Tax=Polyangium jinanense TaxID=2829994 RepID=A0A9X3X3B0_9BACT|nr:PAS domain-containing protein [Polyangium jinanense]MDC3954806.1 PAS domain-containing protein [Polyangium jinanense]MDC3981423.1 PAS domain-containing protein [Polyangium jinanense]
MSSIAFEQECAELRARVAELEARLAEQAPAMTNGHYTNGHQTNGHHKNGSPSDQDGETRLLRAAIHSLADGVVVCDGAGRLLHFNAVATSIFGERSEVMPTEWSMRYGIYHLDGVTPFPTHEMPLVRALQGESVDAVEFFVRSEQLPAGRYIECSARGIRDADGDLCGAVAVCRDLGERRRYEAEREQRLRAEEERLTAEKERLRMARILQSLLDQLDVVVWVTDKKGDFTFHDGQGCPAAGFERGSLVGKNIFEISPGDRLVQRALLGSAAYDRTQTNGTFWDNWVIPFGEDDKEVSGVLGLSLNVTEAHQAKAELEAKLAVIQRQQEVIFNLETPIIQVWDNVLTLPMVGVVDSRRAARVTDDLLAEVSRTQARFAILDLTGVDVVDTATAGHMLNIITAVRLLGAEGIITGIRPNVAQTMVSLGLDLSRVRTLATLRDGLAFAIRKLSDDGSAVRRAAALSRPTRSAEPE